MVSINLLYSLQHLLQNMHLIKTKESTLQLNHALDRIETELADRVNELSLTEMSLVFHALSQYNQSAEQPIKMQLLLMEMEAVARINLQAFEHKSFIACYCSYV